MMTRRHALGRVAVASVAATQAASLGGLAAQATAPAAAAPPAAPAGPFQLPPLGYAYDALEPFIDARTMEIHHDRHHAAYVQNLNKAVAGQAGLAGRSVEDLLRGLASLPEQVRTAVRNHGGGHANHSLFWILLKKNEGAGPRVELAQALERDFGSVAVFQQEFAKAAMSVFGSGWTWVSAEGRKLRLETTPNQDSPWSQGRTPILALDLWEHAYYLKYQNRRAEYVEAFFKVIHWDAVSEAYARLPA